MDELKIETRVGAITLHDTNAGIEIEIEGEDVAQLLLTRKQAADLVAKLALMLADPTAGRR